LIDTIEFGIEKDFDFDKVKVWKKTLAREETGEVYESYFYNDDFINVNIDAKGLSVKTTLSKLYGLGDNNFYPLGVNEMEISINERLPKMLNEIGIVCDLDKAKIWRLDLFKNASLSHNYQAYKRVLSTLHLKRTENRQYPDGYLVGNTLRQVIFYNKVKELKKKLGSFYVRHLGLNDENVMRGEIRFLKHRENKRHGIVYLKEIPDKWDLLKEIYRGYMREIFKYSFKGGESMSEEALEILVNNAMASLIMEGKYALQYYGLYPYSFVNRGDLLNALRVHFSRAQVYRILRNIDKARRAFEANKEYKKLYDELKVKFTEG
jgi:hypothetical protein